MTRRTGLAKTAALASLLLLAMLACDGGGSPTSPPLGARLTIAMRDAPTDEVSQVNVYITGLTVKPSAGPVVRLANDIGLVDLLVLRATTRELATAGVEPGHYEFVQVDLDEARSSVVELASGQARPLRLASDEIKVVGGFDVPAEGETVVTLDFDAAASLQRLGNGDWLLTPVIVMLGAASS